MANEPAAVVDAPAKTKWLRQINWWLLLIPPVSAGVAVVFSILLPDTFHDLQNHLETPAPYIMMAVAAIYAVRAVAGRNPLHFWLAALATTFMLREFHPEWMSHGVYYMLAALGVSAGLAAKRLAKPLQQWRHTSWLIATFAAYFFSQLIARRAFKGIPGEHEIHRSLEEWAETTAHVMFFVTAIIACFGKRKAATTEEG